MNQVAEVKRNLSDEIDTINSLMKQKERSSKVKSSLRNLQEVKTKLDKAYENVCDLLKPEAPKGLSKLEKDIKEFGVKIQEATTVSLNYADRSNEEKISGTYQRLRMCWRKLSPGKTFR